MEEQLAAYRSRKAREQSEQAANTTWFGTKKSTDKEQEDTDRTSDNADRVFNYSGTTSDHTVNQGSGWFKLPSVITNSRHAVYISQDTSLLTNTLFLKVILWLALLGFFIIVEFVAVFVVLTLFYVMYANMRSSDDYKKPGELSAYSVFNPNCERIDGSLTAEQFEKELRYGPGST